MVEPADVRRHVVARTSTIFATGDLDGADRIRMWEDHNARSLIALRCRTIASPRFDATEFNTDIDDIGIARVLGTPHVVERSRDVISRHPCEAVACYLAIKGAASFRHSGDTTTLRPGQLLVCDADRPFVRGFSRGLEELVIRIPRQVFTHDVSSRSLRSEVVCDLRTEDVRGRTLARLVGGALRPQSTEPLGRDLLLAMLGSILGGPCRDVSAVHFATASTVIHERLADPDLDVSTIATAIGLSPRHLSRVFASAGVSVPQYVLAHRLERAHTVLSGGTDRSIARVAAECGFRSVSHFSRTFREHYGMRASDVSAGRTGQ